MELPGRAAHAIRSCLCMFGTGRTSSRKLRTNPKFNQTWSLFGLLFIMETVKIGTWGTEGCKMVGQGAFWGTKCRENAQFRDANGGCGNRLGCKMEGPGAFREHGGGYGASRIGYAATVLGGGVLNLACKGNSGATSSATVV